MLLANNILDCHRSGKNHHQPYSIIMLLLEKDKLAKHLPFLRQHLQETKSISISLSEFLKKQKKGFYLCTSTTPSLLLTPLLTSLLVPASPSLVSFLMLMYNLYFLFILFNFNDYLTSQGAAVSSYPAANFPN